MARRRSQRQVANGCGASQGRKPADPGRFGARGVTGVRRWVFRLWAAALPFLVLVVCELLLRGVGAGYDVRFFVPDPGGDRLVRVENASFGRRFFPRRLVRAPQALRVTVPKPEGTVRIFVLGESAALGDPRPRYGAARYLQVLLEERYPSVRFEVVNTSMTAINSHAIREIAGDLVGMGGDIWVVYMGNNEMVGPFGAATVFGPKAPPWEWVRVGLTLQRLRLVQCLRSVWEERVGRGQVPPTWEGMAMFLRNVVPPDDPRRERVYRSFAANLEAILSEARRAGAKVVLSTVAVNLRDCAPFYSVDPVVAGGEATNSLNDLFRRSEEARAEDRPEEAVRWARAAVALAPRHAEARYRLARALQALGRVEEAREEFQRACDLDALPFRTDGRLNAIIRSVAARQGDGVVLCDAARYLPEEAPGGVPGREFFYEHVHLNFDGNYRLARLWAEHVERLLPEPIRAGARADWASQAVCEEHLGLTDWNRRSVVAEMVQRLQQPPFVQQWEHEDQVAHLRRWLDVLDARIRATAPEVARAVYERALERRPADPVLHENFAEFLEATGDREAALGQWRQVCSLLPHHYFGYYCAGTLLKEMRRLDEALEALQTAARLQPEVADVQVELGSVWAARGEWEAARETLRRARDLDPTHPQAALFLGAVLVQLGRVHEALPELRDAVRLNPRSAQARMRLGELLMRLGSWQEGLDQLQEAIRLDPALDRARLQLAAAWLQQGDLKRAREEIELVLARDPNHPAALRLKAELERETAGRR